MPQKQFAQSAPQLHVAPSVQPAAGHSFSRPPPARPAAPQQRPLQQTFGSHRGQSHSSALAPASVSNGNWPTDIVVVSAQAKVRALQVDEGSRSCKVLWEHSLASAVSSFLGGALHLDTLVADDSCVYVASRGRVRCFDVVSGIARWEEEPEGLNKGIFGAYDLAFMSAVGDVLLVTAANMLVCLKKVNGVQVWAMPLDFMVKRDCFVLCLLYGNRVAVASLGWIACYDLQSGQLAWKNKLEVRLLILFHFCVVHLVPFLLLSFSNSL
jgi:outer membrane protein assembly factor BamB